MKGITSVGRKTLGRQTFGRNAQWQPITCLSNVGLKGKYNKIVGEMSVTHMSVFQMSVGQMSNGQMSVGQRLSG